VGNIETYHDAIRREKCTILQAIAGYNSYLFFKKKCLLQNGVGRFDI
jgi:hypothetical protein